MFVFLSYIYCFCSILGQLVDNLCATFGLFTGSLRTTGLQGWILCTFCIRFHCLLTKNLSFEALALHLKFKLKLAIVTA